MPEYETPERLEVVGDQRGSGRDQREIEVDGVEPVVVEEAAPPGAHDLLQVGTGHRDRDQGEVVVVVDLDLELRPLGQRAVGRRIGERAAQCAQLQRPADDVVMPRGCVDRSVVPVVELGVEERRRLAPPGRTGCRVVGDRGRDPAEQEPGLLRPDGQVRPLAVRVRSGHLGVHPGETPVARPVHEEPLGAGEQVLPARRGQRDRLARVPDRVARRSRAHPHVAQQLPGRRLRDHRDVAAVGEPGTHLVRVVDPPHVVGRAVRGDDRRRQHRALVRTEPPEHDPVAISEHAALWGSGRADRSPGGSRQ